VGIWTAWINVLPRLVSDMLAILNTSRPTWISLHETKYGRVRWIRDISIQTTDPAEEFLSHAALYPKMSGTSRFASATSA
jgi:hypothetical protein